MPEGSAQYDPLQPCLNRHSRGWSRRMGQFFFFLNFGLRGDLLFEKNNWFILPFLACDPGW